MAVSASLLAACSPKAAQETGAAQPDARFLYVVDCEAQVDKLDTVKAERLTTIALAQQSERVPKVASAQSGLDGCIAESVLQDPTTKAVSVIVPTTTRVDSEGKRDFQWLTFALPDWTLVSVKPAGTGLVQPPFLDRDAAGALVVKRAEERNVTVEVDVHGYQNADGVLATELIESSADTALLRAFTGEKSRFVLALANRRTRVLTPLRDLPNTTVGNVHLAPGGQFVLVEVTRPGSASVRRTGALRLYDAAGNAVRDVTDQGSPDSVFLALTPNGLAVYRSGRDYHFVKLAPEGTHFGTAIVTQPLPEARPGLVYSAQ